MKTGVDSQEPIMTLNVREAQTTTVHEADNCLKTIADDPIKRRYWKEIEQLWRASLDIDVRQLNNLDKRIV